MKKFNIVLIIFFFIFFTYSIINVKEIKNSTFNILITFSKTILPALLPFLILNQLIIKLGILDIFAYIFQFISLPLFKISGKGASIIIISILNGFPSSAIFTSNMLIDKQIAKEEAQRIINAFFLPSFSFLFGVLKVNMKNNYLFTILILSLYLISFSFLYFSSLKTKVEPDFVSFTKTINQIKLKVDNFKFSKNIKEIINYSFTTILNILGIIIIFSVPCNILDKFIKTSPSYLIKGLIEFSIPSISLLTSNINKKIVTLFLSTILSFSGLSSIMQASLFINDASLNNKNFIINRILISTITTIFLSIILFFFL